MKKVLLSTIIAFAVFSLNAKTIFNVSDLEAGDLKTTSSTTDGVISLLGTSDKAVAIEANSQYFHDEPTTLTAQSEGTNYTKRAKTSGISGNDYRCFTVNATTAGTLKIAVRTGSSGATDRTVIVKQGETELYNEIVQETDAVDVGGKNVYPYINIDVANAGTIWIGAGVNSMYFYAVEWAPTGETSINVIEENYGNVIAVEVYALSGVKIASAASLDAIQLEKGIYIVKSIYENGKSVVSKIAK